MKSTSKFFGVPSEYFVAFFISIRSYYEEPYENPPGITVHLPSGKIGFTSRISASSLGKTDADNTALITEDTASNYLG